MYLYGAGGHAKVILEILEVLKIPVKGLFDDNLSVKSLLDYPVSIFTGQKMFEGEDFIISIGNNKIREEVATRLPVSFGIAIHPQSMVSHRAEIGQGTVVMAGVTINSEANIGKHCIINTNASIDHDCLLGDFIHISPNATLCGGVTVGKGTHIGAGAVIIPGVKIGDWCTVGAGAVIIRDISNGTTVVGNPGKMINHK